jgi:V/A-type H+-transporting ATPase subunit D
MSTTPANRAARLHLIDRLDLAHHAAELLHGKEQALQRERVRLAAHADRTNREWVRSCEQAAVWLQRVRCLGGSGEISMLAARVAQPADVTISWQSSMGITYPDSVECTPGRQPALSSTAAMGPAMDAHHQALRHAAAHASTTTALSRLDAELASTRRRRRAIRDRLVPSLEARLNDLDLHLDEQDRDEALRVHLAAQTGSSSPIERTRT